MSVPNPKSDYLMLVRGTDWDKGLSPEQLQQTMGQLMAWMEGLQRRGVVKAGQPLGGEGRCISGKNGRTVADGPFAESKEAVGGYFLVQAGEIDEVVAYAKTFPCLEYGASIEVRPVLGECPTFKRIKEQMSQVAA